MRNPLRGLTKLLGYFRGRLYASYTRRSSQLLQHTCRHEEKPISYMPLGPNGENVMTYRCIRCGRTRQEVEHKMMDIF